MVDFGLISGRKTNNLARQAQVAPSLAKLALNTSASQHKSWKRCKRYWWLQKVAGLRERDKQHFVIGKALHSVAELYISGAVSQWDELFPAGWDTGLEPEESTWIRDVAGKAVQDGVWQAVPGSYIEYPLAFLVGQEFTDARGLPLLAKAQTYEDDKGVRRVANLTELHDGSPLPAGWNRLPPFVGFIDHLILWDNPPSVRDHKTSKHRGYATTPKKLADDLQVLTYAAVPMVLRPEIEQVSLVHNLFLKNVDSPTSKQVYAVTAEAPLEKVRQQWREVILNSEEMHRVRAEAPRIVDPSNPYRRADNWHKVKSAIEEGRPDACKEYGGCPAKDLCFGRCTAEQLIRRTDSPDPMPLVKQAGRVAGPATSFGLNLKSRSGTTIAPPPTTTAPVASPRSTMPFPKAAPITPKVNDDVYVLDPETPNVQMLARVIKLNADGRTATIALYPNADVVPNFDTIGRNYLVPEIELSALMMIPHATAKVVGYQELSASNGIADGLEWSPAAVATTPAVATTKQPTARTEPDGKFGLKVAGAAAAPTPVASTPTPATAPKPVPAGAPAWAASLRKGMLLRVAPTDHPRWAKYAGQSAMVDDAPTPGDTEGSLLITVYIDGLPHPDVNCWRFEPVAAAAPTPTALPDDLRGRAAALVGKHIGVVLHSTHALTNCVLEAADDTGITILGGKVKPWADVRSLDPMGRIPGAPPSKEEKAAAKAEAKAQKAATKAAEQASTAAAVPQGATTAQESLPGTDPKPDVAPAGALDAAINAIESALNGGKVTRKVLEGVLPLLASAKQYQMHFGVVLAPGTHIASGSRLGAGSVTVPPLFKPSEIGKVVDEAKALIAKASDMLGKVIEF